MPVLQDEIVENHMSKSTQGYDYAEVSWRHGTSKEKGADLEIYYDPKDPNVIIFEWMNVDGGKQDDLNGERMVSDANTKSAEEICDEIYNTKKEK